MLQAIQNPQTVKYAPLVGTLAVIVEETAVRHAVLNAGGVTVNHLTSTVSLFSLKKMGRSIPVNHATRNARIDNGLNSASLCQGRLRAELANLRIPPGPISQQLG